MVPYLLEEEPHQDRRWEQGGTIDRQKLHRTKDPAHIGLRTETGINVWLNN